MVACGYCFPRICRWAWARSSPRAAQGVPVKLNAWFPILSYVSNELREVVRPYGTRSNGREDDEHACETAWTVSRRGRKILDTGHDDKSHPGFDGARGFLLPAGSGSASTPGS